jgi:hypothetical protein
VVAETLNAIVYYSKNEEAGGATVRLSIGY